MKVSDRQREVLAIVGDGIEGWGEVWVQYDGRSGLDFRNFDRVANALKRRGLVDVDAETGWIEPTALGREVLR